MRCSEERRAALWHRLRVAQSDHSRAQQHQNHQRKPVQRIRIRFLFVMGVSSALPTGADSRPGSAGTSRNRPSSLGAFAIRARVLIASSRIHRRFAIPCEGYPRPVSPERCISRVAAIPSTGDGTTARDSRTLGVSELPRELVGAGLWPMRHQPSTEAASPLPPQSAALLAAPEGRLPSSWEGANPREAIFPSRREALGRSHPSQSSWLVAAVAALTLASGILNVYSVMGHDAGRRRLCAISSRWNSFTSPARRSC